MIVTYKKKTISMPIAVILVIGVLSGLLSIIDNFIWRILLILILLIFLIVATMKKNKLPYIPTLLLTSFSFIIIPWTKNEFRIGLIQIVYLPFIIYGIVLILYNLKRNIPHTIFL